MDGEKGRGIMPNRGAERAEHSAASSEKGESRLGAPRSIRLQRGTAQGIPKFALYFLTGTEKDTEIDNNSNV